MAGWRTTYALLAAAGFSLTSPTIAAPFVPPNDGPVAFRRDLLPVDVETMISLSDDLIVLSQGQNLEQAEGRRNAARMLALAAALNPSNHLPAHAIQKLQEGAPLQKPDKRTLNRSQARVWHMLAWLNMPEAGKEGQSLGACLGDVISLVDPNHPKAAALREAGEKGSWATWIPDVGAYEEKQLADNTKVEEKTPSTEETPAPVTAKITLNEATLITPLWITDKDSGRDVLLPVSVKMTASTVPPAEGVPAVRPMTFSIDFTESSGPIIRMNRGVLGALTKKFGSLPPDSRTVLNLGEERGYLPVRNREALSGPAAVLLGSAISGHAPAGIVIGKIDADGTFQSVPDLWERLRVLSKGSGGRLLMPTDAADLLPALLALEEPEFFLKYDVLLASNIGELMERSSSVTASPLTETLARFQDVRARSAGMPLGQYLANRFVRQRLGEIANEAPYFASARMLASQAAGERPLRISRRILAFELRRAIEPHSWIQGKPAAEIDIAQLDTSYEQSRVEIDRLERYIDSADRDLLTRVRDMTGTMRSFSRASRVSANRDNGAQIIAEAFTTMRASYNSAVAELRVATGEKDTPEPAE